MNTLIGKKAPFFQAQAVENGKIDDNFSLERFLGKYVVLFFYPLDFTFVCPTELHAFNESIDAFSKRNTQVLACSVDSVYCHDAWLKTSKSQGGIAGLRYPLVSDINKSISRQYGVLNEEQGIAYRGLFLIDREGFVRHLLVNDLPLGRSVEEALRMVDALTHFEQHGEVCPANWSSGHKSFEPSPEGVLSYFN